MMRIALDAMGGDYAPEAVVSGAVEALKHTVEKYEVILVGDESVISRELERHHFIRDLPIRIRHASQKIEMQESPARALKLKPDASIPVAVRMIKAGEADAMVSAGNTGAVMAASLFILKPVEGVLRPAVGAFIPHESGFCFLTDVGANVDCKPIHLLQFGMMGSVFISRLFDIESPRVGLLNIGEEEGKGNEKVQEAYNLMKKSRLNFIGNVEGRDIMRGRADVVVCDGFTGNVLIKFGESLARMIELTLKRKIGGNIAGTLGHFLIRPKFRKLLRLFDYQEYGGAPLLGIRGTCIVAHGSSKAKAIRNAIDEAYKMSRQKIYQHIEEKLLRMKEVPVG